MGPLGLDANADSYTVRGEASCPDFADLLSATRGLIAGPWTPL